mgnify:FL=1|tara:strand:+ start:181 stop:2211 length:2031 start_codon:yes stop_codon:yes gene_type:complete
MGIGIALATGFLQGTIDAQKEKKAEELAKQEREAELAATAGDQFFKAMEAGFDINSEFMQNLGRNAFGDKFNVKNIGNVISDIDNTHQIGSKRLPFALDLSKADESFKTLELFDTFLINNPNYYNDLVEQHGKDSAEVKGFVNAVASTRAAVNNFHHAKFSYSGDGEFIKDVFKDYREGDEAFLKAMKDTGVIGSVQFRQTPEKIMKPGGITGVSNEIVPVEELSDTHLVSYTADGSANAVKYDKLAEFIYPADSGNTDISGELKQGVDTLARHLGFDDANHMAMNLDYISYSNLTDDTTQNLIDLGYGARLHKAGVSNLGKLQGATLPASMNQVVSILTEIGGGEVQRNGIILGEDRGAMRRAIYTTMKIEDINPGTPSHVAKGKNGSKFLQEKKYDVVGFSDQKTAVDEATQTMGELINLQEDYNLTGLADKLMRIGIGAVSQAQQIGDLFTSPSSAERFPNLTTNLATNEDGTATTVGQLQATAMEVLGYTTSEKISVMDSIKIALAARMARAVDPSGRLSNQDFEMQLARLGDKGSLDTREGRLAALKRVRQEFAQKAEDMQFTFDIISKETLTAEDMRFIEADRMVVKAIQHRRRMAGIRTAGGRINDAPQPPVPQPIQVTVNPDSDEPAQGFSSYAIGNQTLYIEQSTGKVFNKQNVEVNPDGTPKAGTN